MKKLIKISIVFLAVFAIVTQITVIYISNMSAADSISATKLAAKIENLKEDNLDIQDKILALASYQAISSRAAELGYEDNQNIVSVYTPLPLALGR